MQAAEGHAGLAGAVGFYGSLKREGQRWALDRAPDAKVPVLGLFAGDDENITPDQVAAFDAALPVEHEIHTYEGAPHSFFDRRQEQYADESQDAWERILGFIDGTLDGAAGSSIRRGSSVSRAITRRWICDVPS